VFAGALVVGSIYAGVGCTIKEVDPIDDPRPATSTGDETTTSTVTGMGGAGGNGTGGSSNGGAGGGVDCVGVDGTGVPEQACNEMNITPATAGGTATSNCGMDMDQDPPGYQTCLDGFAVYTAGSFENLQACLSEIGVEPTNACNLDLVLDCIDKVYAEACARAEIDTYCAQLETDCLALDPNSPFNVAKCSGDLAPLSTVGLEEYAACVNSQPDNATCQEAHDVCAG